MNHHPEFLDITILNKKIKQICYDNLNKYKTKFNETYNEKIAALKALDDDIYQEFVSPISKMTRKEDDKWKRSYRIFKRTYSKGRS